MFYSLLVQDTRIRVKTKSYRTTAKLPRTGYCSSRRKVKYMYVSLLEVDHGGIRLHCIKLRSAYLLADSSGPDNTENKISKSETLILKSWRIFAVIFKATDHHFPSVKISIKSVEVLYTKVMEDLCCYF